MTNKIVLRTTDEYLSGFKPIYRPFWGSFLGNAIQYTEEVGLANMREIKTVGDIRVKHITPKDSELRQIAVAEGTKTFKKFFLMNQFIQSEFQDQDGVQDVINQVLDEHNKQADEMLLGDGVNSGLFTSTDANYLSESSKEVAKDANNDYLSDLYKKVMGEKVLADSVDGNKLIMFYGSTILPQYNGLFLNAVRPFKAVLGEALGANYQQMEMPADVTPAGVNGFLIINLDQIRLHWTAMPRLDDQDLNAEKKYYWFNFLMGSMMVDVRAYKGIIKQPLTLAA
jgi:hypothetical protein